MMLSGLVAILDEKGAVIEIRDLGLTPVAVKPGRVVPMEDRKPDGGKEYSPPAVSELAVEKDVVVRTWKEVPPVIDQPSIDDKIVDIERRISALETVKQL